MDNQSIEEYLGFGAGAVEGKGIGGILKVRVEDFRVEEVSSIPALDPKAVSYTHLTLPTTPYV